MFILHDYNWCLPSLSHLKPGNVYLFGYNFLKLRIYVRYKPFELTFWVQIIIRKLLSKTLKYENVR